MSSKLSTLLVLMFCICSWVYGQIDDEINAAAERVLQIDRIPGLAVGVVALADNPECSPLVWIQCYGYSDVVSGERITEESIFRLASVSKIFTGTAIAAAQERGLLSLEEAVNSRLISEGASFTVDHPGDQTLRVSHLVTHSSGLVDNYRFLCSRYAPKQPDDQRPGNYTILYDYIHNSDYCGAFYDLDERGELTLDGFLGSYLQEGETLFSEENFRGGPGDNWEYSNIGTNLAGYLLELAVGMSLADYTQQVLFDPLSMQHTVWTRPPHSSLPFVTQYSLLNGQTRPIPEYTAPTKADGGLRSSVRDLTRFAAEILRIVQDPHYEGVLPRATVMDMLTPKVLDGEDGIGIFWVSEHLANGEKQRLVVGHDGEFLGTLTYFQLDIESGIGVVILANGNDERNEEQQRSRLLHLLFEKGELMREEYHLDSQT